MKKHILVILAENKTGVLNRIVSLCRQRRYNLESVSASETEQPGISHITLMVNAENANIEQLAKQINKMIAVIQVTDMPYEKALHRELVLLRVPYTKDTRSEILQIAETCHAATVDITSKHIIFEFSSTSDKIDALIEMLREFGIDEIKRTGVIALPTD